MIDYLLIIEINYKKCGYSICNNDYNSLIWDNDNPFKKPTKEEFDSQWEETKVIENILKRQKEVIPLLLESDYVELPSFLERKGQETYNLWMSYRANLRLAYHDPDYPLPEKPE
jgi:hypothetical protein